MNVYLTGYLLGPCHSLSLYQGRSRDFSKGAGGGGGGGHTVPG